MSISTNNQSQNNNFIEGIMRALTHIVNELSRQRRHHREDKNQIVDEMCKQHNELSRDNQSLFMEVQRMRVAFESLVHHYHQEEEDMFH